MMKGRWRWNMDTFYEIRHGSGIQSRIIRELESVASAAGPGYEATWGPSGGARPRFRGVVLTTDAWSMRDNAKHNTLLRVSGR